MSPLLSNVILELLANTIRQEKYIKGIQIRKEDENYANSWMALLYIENPKDYTKKLLELISEFSKVTVFGWSTSKNQLPF